MYSHYRQPSHPPTTAGNLILLIPIDQLDEHSVIMTDYRADHIPIRQVDGSKFVDHPFWQNFIWFLKSIQNGALTEDNFPDTYPEQ